MTCLNNVDLVVHECAICSNNNGGFHDCPRCTKDAWFICNNCKETLAKKSPFKCPVCNLDRSDKSNNNTQNINIPPRRNTCYTLNDIKTLFVVISQIIFALLCILAVIIFGQYLGKIYIYVYCTTTCVDKNDPDKCACGKFASRSGYWHDFNYIFGEFICGALVTCIVHGLCCLRRRQ